MIFTSKIAHSSSTVYYFKCCKGAKQTYLQTQELYHTFKSAIEVSDFSIKITALRFYKLSMRNSAMRVSTKEINTAIQIINYQLTIISTAASTVVITLWLVWASASLTVFVFHQLLMGMGKDPTLRNQLLDCTCHLKKNHRIHCSSYSKCLF